MSLLNPFFNIQIMFFFISQCFIIIFWGQVTTLNPFLFFLWIAFCINVIIKPIFYKDWFFSFLSDILVFLVGNNTEPIFIFPMDSILFYVIIKPTFHFLESYWFFMVAKRVGVRRLGPGNSSCLEICLGLIWMWVRPQAFLQFMIKTGEQLACRSPPTIEERNNFAVRCCYKGVTFASGRRLSGQKDQVPDQVSWRSVSSDPATLGLTWFFGGNCRMG